METFSVLPQYFKYYLHKHNHQSCPVKKAVLKSFAILPGKTPVLESLLNKVEFRPANLLK